MNYLDYNLTKEEEKIIRVIIGNIRYMKIQGKEYSCGNPIIYDTVKIMYVLRYKENLSLTDIGDIVGIDSRTLQNRFKKWGWQRTRYEAQAIASKKRDYRAIKTKSNLTIMQNAVKATGSDQEKFIRYIINEKLYLNLLGYEYIVGINNRAILNDEYLEIDIPVIIFKNDFVYRYAIEVNGDYWHKDKGREARKYNALNKTPYIPLVIWTDKDINKQIDKIINIILEDINS